MIVINLPQNLPWLYWVWKENSIKKHKHNNKNVNNKKMKYFKEKLRNKKKFLDNFKIKFHFNEYL